MIFSWTQRGSVYALMSAAVVLCGLPPTGAQPSLGRRDVVKATAPNEASRAAAMKIVAELYEAEWKGAKTASEKTALAEKMTAQAAQTRDDPAGQYVLLQVARDVAVSAGDVTGALRAINLLDAQFEIDAGAMRIAALLGAAGAAKLAEQRMALAEEAPAIIQTAVDRDDYVAAGQLVEAAKSAAGAARDRDLARRLGRIGGDVRRISEAYTAIKPSLALLTEKPADPDANAAVGKFYCLLKGEWGKGIPLLALGSDPALQVPARKELEEIASAEELVDLGDLWWKLAEQAEEQHRDALRGRAGYWYVRALKNLPDGLLKVRVAKRLDEIVAKEPPTTVSPPAPRPVVDNRLRIIATLYGAEDGWVDVTEKLRQAVTESGLSIADTGSHLPNPTPGIYKTLVAVCGYRGKVYAVYAAQGASFRLPSNQPVKRVVVRPLRDAALRSSHDRFVVLDAMWGAQKGWLDITSAAQAAVKDGRLQITNAGHGLQDPAFGQTKAMVIIYANKGQIHIASVRSGQAISLP